MIPASVEPLSYLLRSSVQGEQETTNATWTHVVAKKVAIVLKISVSLLEVSSNPGVSMRVTLLPSRVNLSATWTSSVHDSKPVPTRRFEPLARLINWRQLSEFLVITTKNPVLTEVFPLVVAPMTLWQ